MNKKKALGMDPLTWLKGKNKEKDLNNNAGNHKPVKKPSSGTVMNLVSQKQKAREAKTYEPSEVAGKFRSLVFGGKKSAHKKPKPPAKGRRLGGMIFNGISDEGRLAAKPFEPKVINLPNTEQKMRDVKTYEPSDVTEKYRSEILGGKQSGRKSRFLTIGATENPATIFVVAYTVLLLVLGFFVYKDLTGKISKLDAKLTSMEAQIK